MAMAAACGALPFLPDTTKPGAQTFLLCFSIVACLGSAFGAWYSWQIVRRLPDADISVDEQGLWPTIRNRHGALIPWQSIVALREREVLQRIDALDATGRTVARLEYQLKNFERLRAIVLQRANLGGGATPSSDTFQKPSRYHVFVFVGMLAFALFGAYLGETEPWLGYGMMSFLVAVIAWEYWGTPYHLRITPKALEIRSPGRERRVAREHISAIEVRDEQIQYNKYPAVVLMLTGGEKPVKLKALGVQSVELHQALQAWHRGKP